MSGECQTVSGVNSIIMTYLCLLLVWIILILIFQIYLTYASVVIVIPFILFIIAMIYAPTYASYNKTDLIKDTFVTVIIITAIPFLIWFTSKSRPHSLHITNIVILAIILGVVSLLPVWSDPRGECVWKHCRTGLETMAITLFLYALMTYYIVPDPDPTTNVTQDTDIGEPDEQGEEEEAEELAAETAETDEAALAGEVTAQISGELNLNALSR